jgi:threonylcarbamoyladenosine tRNA methylthiotransferase MtaB
MRVAFTTLGCRLNLYETEAMGRRVRDAGEAELVAWGDEADVYVINSCTVTSRAEQKCRQLARSAKRRRGDAKVVVVGCYTQVNGRPLMELPEIDAALGTEEKKRLDDFLPRILAGERLLEAAAFPRRQAAFQEEWIEDFGGRSRATIKVQEGCNLRCTFCAIWAARGPSRSREPREIVQQARTLAERGYEEIVLGGVHLGHYGWDLRPRSGLRELLTMLLELVDPKVRFRLSSVDPGEVDLSLARFLVEEDRLCRYLHLPLQSGSDAVLRAMRRAYSSDSYRRLVEGVAELDPHFGLGIDLIAGFPGESDADFRATLELLEALPVSFYHVFPYSDRPATVASGLPGKLDGGLIAERCRELRRLGERKRHRFLLSHLGHEFEGVVETGAPGEEGVLSELLLDNYASVWVRGVAHRGRERLRIRVEGMDDQGRLRGAVLASGRSMTSCTG